MQAATNLDPVRCEHKFASAALPALIPAAERFQRLVRIAMTQPCMVALRFSRLTRRAAPIPARKILSGVVRLQFSVIRQTSRRPPESLDVTLLDAPRVSPRATAARPDAALRHLHPYVHFRRSWACREMARCPCLFVLLVCMKGHLHCVCALAGRCTTPPSLQALCWSAVARCSEAAAGAREAAFRRPRDSSNTPSLRCMRPGPGLGP
jgi:hypothetical protein